MSWGPTRGGGSLLQASVTVSAAQILALKESPVTLVPGVPGSVLVPTGQAVIEYVFKTTPYTDNGGSYGLDLAGIGTFWTFSGPGFITTSASQVRFRSPTTTGFGNASVVSGVPLTLIQSTADATLGDGELEITFPYMAVPLL